MVTRIVGHVTHGVDVHHERHEGDHNHHHGAEFINEKTDLEWDPATDRPGINSPVETITLHNIYHYDNGEYERHRDAHYGNAVRAGAADLFSEQTGDDRTQQAR